MPNIMYLARHQVYVKCQLFISMVEQVGNVRFSALNSSIWMMKWDCGGPRISLLWSSYLKSNMILSEVMTRNGMVGWHTPKKRLIKEVSIHHKKDGFFLHNIFIWCLEVQKSDVVLTDHCQIYGLPLTSHVISGQN